MEQKGGKGWLRRLTSILLSHPEAPKLLKTSLRLSEGSKQNMVSAEATPFDEKPRASASAIWNVTFIINVSICRFLAQNA